MNRAPLEYLQALAAFESGHVDLFGLVVQAIAVGFQDGVDFGVNAACKLSPHWARGVISLKARESVDALLLFSGVPRSIGCPILKKPETETAP